MGKKERKGLDIAPPMPPPELLLRSKKPARVSASVIRELEKKASPPEKPSKFNSLKSLDLTTNLPEGKTKTKIDFPPLEEKRSFFSKMFKKKEPEILPELTPFPKTSKKIKLPEVDISNTKKKQKELELPKLTSPPAKKKKSFLDNIFKKEERKYAPPPGYFSQKENKEKPSLKVPKFVPNKSPPRQKPSISFTEKEIKQKKIEPKKPEVKFPEIQKTQFPKKENKGLFSGLFGKRKKEKEKTPEDLGINPEPLPPMENFYDETHYQGPVKGKKSNETTGLDELEQRFGMSESKTKKKIGFPTVPKVTEMPEELPTETKPEKKGIMKTLFRKEKKEELPKPNVINAMEPNITPKPKLDIKLKELQLRPIGADVYGAAKTKGTARPLAHGPSDQKLQQRTEDIGRREDILKQKDIELKNREMILNSREKEITNHAFELNKKQLEVEARLRRAIEAEKNAEETENSSKKIIEQKVQEKLAMLTDVESRLKEDLAYVEKGGITEKKTKALQKTHADLQKKVDETEGALRKIVEKIEKRKVEYDSFERKMNEREERLTKREKELDSQIDLFLEVRRPLIEKQKMLEPKTNQVLFSSIEDCGELVKNGSFQEAKKLYKDILKLYNDLKVSDSEKKELYFQISELYDEIHLGLIG